MTAISYGKFSLDLLRKKGRFALFKQSLEVHWLSITLGYNLPMAYWPLVRCSRLFSLSELQAFSLIFDRLIWGLIYIYAAIIYSFFVTSKHHHACLILEFIEYALYKLPIHKSENKV